MKQKLMIVADFGRLKAFRVDWTLQKTPRLEPLEEMEFEEAHRRVLDTVTDMAGRHAAPTQRHWGAPIADVHNLELETRRRLIRRLAKRIEQLIERDGRDGCWLAAHKEINRQILDETGRIIAINAAWQNFGDANGLRYPAYGLGSNYLTVCDGARGQCANEAAQVAASIRRLLRDRHGCFSLEYPFDNPKEQRWFQVTGESFEHDSRCYAVIAHLDITIKKQAGYASLEA